MRYTYLKCLWIFLIIIILLKPYNLKVILILQKKGPQKIGVSLKNEQFLKASF